MSEYQKQEQAAKAIIRRALTHAANGAAMQSSAILCIADALNLIEGAFAADAARRAIKSLGYSVGIFHTDYQWATKLFATQFNATI
jgi:ABC-type proline/glycine betaine transport system substrate-binding protein